MSAHDGETLARLELAAENERDERRFVFGHEILAQFHGAPLIGELELGETGLAKHVTSRVDHVKRRRALVQKVYELGCVY